MAEGAAAAATRVHTWPRRDCMWLQVYFHRKSGYERIAPPTSKGKDGDLHHRHVVHHGTAAGGHGSVVHYHPAYHAAVHPVHAVDAAAAMAVAALRSRWAPPPPPSVSRGHPSAPHIALLRQRA